MPWDDCVAKDWDDCIFTDTEDCIWDKHSVAHHDALSRAPRDAKTTFERTQIVDYGKRPYLAARGEDYVKFMARDSDKVLEDTLRNRRGEATKHLLYKKPYRHSSPPRTLQEMKYRNASPLSYNDSLSEFLATGGPGGTPGGAGNIELKEAEKIWQWVRYFDNTRWGPPTGRWFYDDFDIIDANIWTDYSSGGTNSIENGKLKMVSTQSGDYAYLTTAVDATIPSTFTWTFQLNIASGTGEMNFTLKDGVHYFWIIFDPPTTIKFRQADGQYKSITVDNYVGQTHTWKFVYDGTTCDIYRGLTLIDSDLTLLDWTANKGERFLSCDNVLTAYVDDYIITSAVTKDETMWSDNRWILSGTNPMMTLEAIGNWYRDFRPKKIRIKYDKISFASTDFSLWLYPRASTPFPTQLAYNSGQEVILDFTGRNDIESLKIGPSTGTGEFAVTDIEFLVLNGDGDVKTGRMGRLPWR